MFRHFIATVLIMLSINAAAGQGQNFPEKKLGEMGFAHTHERHKAYQEMFKDGRCLCSVGIGQCRPTVIRSVSIEESPTGLLAYIGNGEWCPIPQNAWVDDRKVPNIIRKDRPEGTNGDICSRRNTANEMDFGKRGMCSESIECAWIIVEN